VRVSEKFPDEDEIVARLRAAGCVFAEEEAALLLEAASSPAELESMVVRRVEGLPLEHILGWAEFLGLRIAVGPGVFVPRRRTEFLAVLAIALARDAEHPVVLDLCCGAGALGVVIAAANPGVELYAADLDGAAVQSARLNFGARGEVFEGDLFEPLPASLRGRVTVLACNTPYVPTEAIATMPPEARLHEARIALDGGADGLDVQRRVAKAAIDWLAPGGSLLVESSENQAPESARIFEAAGLLARIETDEDLDATVVIGTRPLD
jgi:release factor glutamine methyltransferase